MVFFLGAVYLDRTDVIGVSEFSPEYMCVYPKIPNTLSESYIYRLNYQLLLQRKSDAWTLHATTALERLLKQ